MSFSDEARITALNAAFEALVTSLAQSKTLDAKFFKRGAIQAIRRLHAQGDTQASLAAAALLEPIMEKLEHFPARD